MRNLITAELRQKLEDHLLNLDGCIAQLKKRVANANIPLTDTTGKIFPGYVLNSP